MFIQFEHLYLPLAPLFVIILCSGHSHEILIVCYIHENTKMVGKWVWGKLFHKSVLNGVPCFLVPMEQGTKCCIQTFVKIL